MPENSVEQPGDPPPFGHPMLQYFRFGSSYINLNNENSPDRFMRFTSKPLLTSVRAQIAELVGTETDEVVLVPNTSHGLNTVLRNLEWNRGDPSIGTTVSFIGISRAIQYITDIPPHPQQAALSLIFPTDQSTILLDVDGAHSLGQEDINLKEADPEFWVSSGHKRLYTMLGCAVLYVPKRNQHLIKSAFPTSSYYISPSDPETPDFAAQFQSTGTTDLGLYSSIKPALELHRWIGGEQKINGYCRHLAVAGGKKLAEILKTRVLDEVGVFTVNMTNVELPLDAKESPVTIIRIQERLLDDWNIFAKPFYHNGK